MKIIVVTNGDSFSARTWSGVPLRFCEELRAQGHSVENLNLDKVSYLKVPRIIFNRIIRKVVRPWRWIPFEATRIGVLLQNLAVRAYVNRRNDSQVVIAFSFSISGKGLRIPLVLVHDWPNGMLQEIFHQRPMSKAERLADKRIFRQMQFAAKVVSIYPLGCNYLRANGVTNAVFYCNPINADKVEHIEVAVEKGLTSSHILCCGGSNYIENVRTVIRAVNLLNRPDLVIDVIGLKEIDEKLLVGKINFYGYLSKSDPVQDALYNDLFTNARCLVNVRPGWGGGSSIAEAMYRGKPVIVGDYPEIVALYGGDAKFGYYTKPGDENGLAQCIRDILDVPAEEYKSLCSTAHTLTAHDTYGEFLKKVVEL